MDPLSITASVIALCQAAAMTGDGLRTLIELGRADDELLELTNEVSQNISAKYRLS
jgi:hypothetical protein